MASPSDSSVPTVDDELPLIRPSRRWPIVAALGVLVLGAGIWGVRSLAEPLPLRVVVAIDLEGQFWEDSRPAAAVVNELCQRLDAIGLEPVRGGDPSILKILQNAKNPDESARKLGASFVVTAKLTPEVIEHERLHSGKGEGPGRGFEARVDGAIEVHYVGEEPASQGRLVSWAGASERPEALRLLGKSLGMQAFDQVLPHIVEHPSIQAIFKSDDIKLADKVAKAKKYVEVRATRLEEANKSYVDLEQRRAKFDTGPAKVTYHSVMSAQDGIGGVSSLGILVKSADVTPFVAPRTMELSYISGLETLEWRKPGAPRQVLWAGYHLFSYPSATPGGGPVVFVEDLFGWAKALTVVSPDGKFRRVRTDSEHRYLDPKIAPGGARCALYDRPCRECTANLLVVSLDKGESVFEKSAEDGSFYVGFAWLGPQTLAYLTTPAASEKEAAEAPLMELRIADLSKNPPVDTLAWKTAPGESLAGLEASQDGKRLVMEHFQAWTKLGLYDVETKKFASIDTGFEAKAPALSPDGKLVALTRGGDLFLWDIEKKQALRLTKNPWRERYPIFSEDGKQIYFESRGEDPLFDRRELSLIGSVLVKDAGALDADAKEERGEK